jgi:hypothetical protein
MDQEEEYHQDQMPDLLSSSPQSQDQCLHPITWPMDQEEEEEEEIHQEGPETTDLLLLLVVLLILVFLLLSDLIPTGIPCTPLSEMAECEWILKESGR